MINPLAIIRKSRISRFIVVGFTNALLHFTILNFSFYVLDKSKIISSFIATFCAVCFSFIMNRNFVFSDRSTRPVKQLLLFIVVTLSGMLIIHNIAYAITLRLIKDNESMFINVINYISGITLSNDFVDINISTVVGACFALVWNYNGYRKFVFKDSHVYEEEIKDV